MKLLKHHKRLKFRKTDHMGVEQHPSYPSSQSKTGKATHQNKQSIKDMELEVQCRRRLT